MELVNVRDLFRRQDEYVDQTIAIGGWVRNIRNSKNFGFIVVNDGTFFEPVQVVYSDVHRLIHCRRKNTALSI